MSAPTASPASSHKLQTDERTHATTNLLFTRLIGGETSSVRAWAFLWREHLMRRKLGMVLLAAAGVLAAVVLLKPSWSSAGLASPEAVLEDGQAAGPQLPI